MAIETIFFILLGVGACVFFILGVLEDLPKPKTEGTTGNVPKQNAPPDMKRPSISTGKTNEKGEYQPVSMSTTSMSITGS